MSSCRWKAERSAATAGGALLTGRIRRTLPLMCLWLLAAAHPAHAQPPASATDIPDKFVIEAGGFNMFVSTALTLNSPDLGGSEVNLEKNLNLPDTAYRGYIEGLWRPF